MRIGRRALHERRRTARMPAVRNFCRLLFIALCSLVAIVATTRTANAQCRYPRHGVSLTYQYGPGMLEHAGKKGNEEVTERVREYVPSAPAADLNRPEHTFKLNYDLLMRNYMHLRVYGGVSITPNSAVYQASGDGYYNGFNIGQVDLTGKTYVNIYTIGSDLLFQTGGCQPTVLRLVGGPGLGISGFHGGMSGDFDALITGPGTDRSLSGTFHGFAVHGSLMGGLKLDIADHANIMFLGGYRAGIGYGKVESEIFNKEGPVPVYGPFFQITLGGRF